MQPRGSQADYIALAMARNPAIRTQTRQAELAGLNLRSTRFGRRPDIAIGPSVEYLDNEQTYGLSATLALPLWDQKKGAIETATAEQKKALAELEKTRAEIAGEVTKASAISADRQGAAGALLACVSRTVEESDGASRTRLRAERDNVAHLSRRQAHLLRHAGRLLRSRSRKLRKHAAISNRRSVFLSKSKP